VNRLLAIGVPGLAIAALLGGAIGDPFRARFLGDALGDAIVFVAAAVLALSFARLAAVGADGGFDWRSNPGWLGLTILLLVAAIVIAIPLSAVAGTAISVLVSIALGPLFILGIATGMDRAARRVLLFFVAVGVLAYLITRGPFPIQLPDPATPGFAGQGAPTTAEQVAAASLGGLLLIAALAGLLVLIALWMRRVRPPGGEILEERSIVLGDDAPLLRRARRRFGRRPDPRTAIEAYVALVDDLDRHPEVRREIHETPGAHAARLRAAGRTELSLDLLAADYELARYGGLELPGREDRRAVARWRRLRRRLLVRPAGLTVRAGRDGTSPPTSGDAELPVDLEPRRTF
jgi:hypothetical protein